MFAPTRVFAALLLALAAEACARPPALPAEPVPPPAPPAAAVSVTVEKNTSELEPVATRREDVHDVLHGTRVSDPYRWLEDGSSPDVKQWIAAQNRLTERTLGAVSGRAELKRRIEDYLQIGQLTMPVVRRRADKSLRYFYTRREGKQNQPVLLARDGLRGKDRAIVDPNALDAQGTTALDWHYPSETGRYVAYGLSKNGSEESTLHVYDLDSGQALPDVIERTRAASVCWMPDSTRFFYSRYPKPGSVPAGEEAYHRQLYEHVLGQPPESDRLVFGAGREMTDYPTCTLSPDGRWLLVRVHQGWSKSELFIADTRAPQLTFTRMTEGKSHLYDPIARNDRIYVHTNEGAPRYALYAADPRRPARKHWKLVVPEHEADVLDTVEVVSGQILAGYLHEATSRLERFDLAGSSRGPIPLPTIGSSNGFSGLHDGDEAFFHFESFAIPPRIHRLDLGSRETSIWESVQSPIRADEYRITPGKARSKDGTQIPYLTVRSKKSESRTGPQPTLLYGYGGFNQSLQPRFSRTNSVLLERGVVFVQANLRGGGEFGEEWHRQGQLERKQNTFDDFIAVAEKLIADGVTASDKLAVFGRSNGGLLVAAMITQRPDLFRAAISSVPLTDMVRYERFLIAKLWSPEYGSAADKAQFETLLSYSPYHRVREGTAYPAVLLTTAVSDTRVDPMHARKLAAALQHATSSKQPILLRTETEAGHGAGKPISKVAEEFADIFAFTLWQLGILPTTSPLRDGAAETTRQAQ